MKRALPANAKISKDAKETLQECVSEFISFITGEASDKCKREKRKTVNGDDLLWAMSTLGFEDYIEPLKVYLQKYREFEGERTTIAKQGEPVMVVGKEGGGSNGISAGHMHMAQQAPSGASYMYPQQQQYVQSNYHMSASSSGGHGSQAQGS
jgi:histone H3/H4